MAIMAQQHCADFYIATRRKSEVFIIAAYTKPLFQFEFVLNLASEQEPGVIYLV
jgi:hypothetical protein